MLQRIRIKIPKTTMTYMAILAVAVVGAVMREINLLIILAGMMSGPLLISRVMIRSTLRDLKVKRRVPRSVFLGAPCRVEIEVQNPRKRVDSWALVAEDRMRNTSQGSHETHTARAFLPHVPRGRAATTRYEASFKTRGRYRFGPLQITTKVPVGLLKGYRKFVLSDEVVVYPKLGELLQGWSSFARFEHSGSQSSRRRQGPVSGDFYGLRDWRSGDARRWIHWRSSAKRNQLVVRQYEQQQNHDLMLLLDLKIDHTNEKLADDVDRVMVERAISFVATLVAQHCSRGAGMLTLSVDGNRQLQVRGPASTGVMNDALEVLAELQTERTTNTDSPAADEERNDSAGRLPAIASEDQVVAVSIGRFQWERWVDDRDPMSGNYSAQATEIDLAHSTLDTIFRVDGLEADEVEQTAARPSSSSPTSSRPAPSIPGGV